MMDALLLWINDLHPVVHYVACAWLALCLSFILVVLILLVNGSDRRPVPGHFGPVTNPRAAARPPER